ncbi:MAG TPA: Fe-S cluster assembly ATPase SufC [Acidimicrobiales bacterium]
MTELVIQGLRAGVDGKDILQGIDLTIRSGEVHAVMGPNGSGKSTLSHVILGRPGYQVTGGSITLDGRDVLAMETWERAQAGLFLALQYPTEVPGVSVEEMLVASFVAGGRDAATVGVRVSAEAERIGFGERFLGRDLNVDLSGGEKKRNETLQLGVLEPKIAVLDELDSGLDVDALRDCSRRVEAATSETGLGVLAITHYTRLLTELKPDVVHILVKGRIRATGGPELADELEEHGYARYLPEGEPVDADEAASAAAPDPFADPFAG